MIGRMGSPDSNAWKIAEQKRKTECEKKVSIFVRFLRLFKKKRDA